MHFVLRKLGKAIAASGMLLDGLVLGYSERITLVMHAEIPLLESIS